jgi:hypothetical protein
MNSLADERILRSFGGDDQMHGLIFVTWEKYLSERFGSSLFQKYRAAIGETPATSPLASRVYDDAMLLAGVGVACKLTRLPADMLLREYGRYFILNGLTRHLCTYLLSQVHSGRDLLLTMRDAHAQMRRTPDALTPPLFGYEPLASTPNGLALIYDSPRQLCAVLWGAVEGAAERYGERVQIHEAVCMKRGAALCRLEVTFFSQASGPLERLETAEQVAKRNAQHHFANLVLQALPDHDGRTLLEVQAILQQWQVSPNQLRPIIVLEALRHLGHVGLVASTANHPGDDLARRRYWRVPTAGK